MFSKIVDILEKFYDFLSDVANTILDFLWDIL